MTERDSEAAARRRPFLMLPSKVACPQPEPDAIAREGVAGKLDGAQRATATTVVAPAGFGKTSAVAAWAARQALPVAWYSLDEDDADPARFWYGVACAVAAAGVELDPADMADVPWADAAEARATLTDLVLRLAEGTDGLFIVLEDFHVLDDAPLVAETAAFFLRNLPPHVHLVVTSRTPVRLPLAKIRARGALVEVTEADLRLTPAEQAQLLSDLPHGLTPDELALVNEATQGWPAGCRLVELRCRQAGSAEALADVLGQAQATMREYLFEEVVESLPADLLDFMTATSAPEAFCVPLAAAMTGLSETDARALIDRAVEGGLFIQRMEGEGSWMWFRYHQLLCDLLRSRLRRRDGAEVAALRQRAIDWFLAEGFDDAAVGLAYDARDWDTAAAIIEQRWKSLYMNGSLEILLRWVGLLPESYLEDRPLLCAVAALPMANSGDLMGARKLIQRALLGLRDNEGFLFALCMVQQAFIASFEAKAERSAAFAEKALQFLPEEERYLRSMMSQVRASALWSTDPEAVLMLYRDVLEDQRDLGNAVVYSSALCNLALIEVSMGHEGDARRHAEEALSLFSEAERTTLSMLHYAWRVLAECAFEEGDGEAFERAVAAYDEVASHGALPSRNAEVAMLRAKQAYRNRNDQKGRDLMFRAFAIDDEAAAAMVPTLAMARDWRERFRSQADALDGASPLAAQRLFAAAAALAAGNSDGGTWALGVAEGVRETEYALRVRALVLAAIGFERAGRAQQALACVRKAYALSRDHGLHAAFSENASDMQPLVRLLRGGALGDAAENREADAAAARAIEEASAPAQGAADLLTARELEIMAIVADGASVAQAADELVVSRETVKKHLGNIYAKLGVHSKMQAVALLRDEGAL